MAASLTSCEKAVIPDDISGISLKSVEVFVEYTAAKVFGEIRVSQNPERISEVRVYYGTASDALSKSVKAAYDTENGFSADITSLEDGAQFFYRVDIIVGKTPIEGKVQDFVTFPKGPIDLDLPSGKRWASHNIGATQPTESGGFFAWAELTEKTQYDWSSYVYCKGAMNKLTKYTLRSHMSYDGTIDNHVELLPQDDAARKTLGEHYSVPSYKDWKELQENCVLTAITVNGCTGCKVSSKKDMNNNKKFIFLPGFYGYYNGTSKVNDASYYWSSTLYSEMESDALNVKVMSDIISTRGSRCYGELVRPIYE